MQEDIDHRAVALVINTTKMTGRALKSAITKYLAHCRQKAKAPPTGRQTVRELVGQGQGVTNIEITDGNIRSFERVARKYGVDYALKKGPGEAALPGVLQGERCGCADRGV